MTHKLCNLQLTTRRNAAKRSGFIDYKQKHFTFLSLAAHNDNVEICLLSPRHEKRPTSSSDEENTENTVVKEEKALITFE
jgi:hypothetical protein